MDRAPEQDKEQAGPQDRRLSAVPSGQKMALLKKGSCDEREDFRGGCGIIVVRRDRVVLEMTLGAASAYWLDPEVPKLRDGWTSFQRRKCPVLPYHRRRADYFADVTLISWRRSFANLYRASVTEEQKPKCNFVRVILFGRFGSCDPVHMHKRQVEL
jgi:hypothetical protein